MVTKIDAISFALMLRPNSASHGGRWRTPSGCSVSGMDRHRNFSAHALQSGERGYARLLLRENGQIAGDKSEDGEAERDEHGCDHDFRPLRGIARTYGVFDASDSDVEPIGDESQQSQYRRQIESLGVITHLRNQQKSQGSDDREKYLQQEEALLMSRDEDHSQHSAVIKVFKAQDAVDGEHHHQHASQVFQDR